MSYSLSEAATACGVYKSTILRSIKTGRLTGTKNEFGQWRIEPAELHRVYPPAQCNGADSNGTRHGATAALVEAQHRAELAEQRLAMLTLVLDDLRLQRDQWQQQAERLTITDARARGGAASLPSARHMPLRHRCDHQGSDLITGLAGCHSGRLAFLFRSWEMEPT
jgi:hypothetical protein